MRTEILRVQGLSAKRMFGCDLKQINMNLYEGEVLGIVGLHDSGKSFFFDCLMGKKSADKGKIFLYEEKKEANNFKRSDFIFRIQSKSALVESCTVMENVFIVRRQRRRKAFIPWRAVKMQAISCMQEFEIPIRPEHIVSELSMVERHIVEILKAYVSGAKLILIDDVMTSYTNGDYDELYKVIRRFQEKGISFIICGCQMEKLQRLTERCLFMVNGSAVKVVDNIRRNQIDEMKVLMGNSKKRTQIKSDRTEQSRVSGKVLLEAREVQVNRAGKINFQIKEGEIVVLVDMFRQWVPQMVDAINGASGFEGEFFAEGKIVKRKNKKVLVSDFLESNYTISSLSFRDNLCLAVYKRISTLGFLHPVKAKTVEKLFKEQYQIKEEHYGFQWEDLSFGEKMAVYLERVKLQKWKIMFCTNVENIMSYELEDMVKEQLKKMACAKRAICICSTSIEKYSDLADYFLLFTEEKKLEKFTYTQLCDYFKI